MIPVRQRRVRGLLRDHPDGLSAHQIAEVTGIHVSNVRTALRAMPDVYVDRWEPGKRGQFVKVWCAVYVPPPCPHPRDRVFPRQKEVPKTRWVMPIAANQP